jgi:hypothetical protein
MDDVILFHKEDSLAYFKIKDGFTTLHKNGRYDAIFGKYYPDGIPDEIMVKQQH